MKTNHFNSEWTCFVTPKAYSDMKDSLLQLCNQGVKIVPTTDIYINCLYENWTREKCDSIAYLVKTSDIILEYGFKWSIDEN